MSGSPPHDGRRVAHLPGDRGAWVLYVQWGVGKACYCPSCAIEPGSEGEVPLVPSAGSAADHSGLCRAVWGEPGLGQHLLGRHIV
jgi:hypothetical protein